MKIETIIFANSFSLIIFYITGLLFPFGNYFKEKIAPSMMVALRLFVGFVTVITIFSIATVGLQTVNIIAVPVLLFLWINGFVKKKTWHFKNIDKNDWLLFIAVLSINLLLILLQLWNSEVFKGGVKFHFVDFGFYSNISQGLLNFKQEAVHIGSRAFDDIVVNEPYHFFELWANAFFIKYWSLVPLTSYLFVLIPILATMQIFSLFALLDYFNINKLISLTTAILLSFFVSAYWFRLPMHPENIYYYQKGWAAFIAGPLIIWFIFNRHLRAGLILSLILPISNIVNVPIILLVYFALVLYALISKKNLNIKNLLIAGVFVCLIPIYYLFGKSSFHQSNQIDFWYFFSTSYWVPALKHLYISIKIIILYLLLVNFWFLPIVKKYWGTGEKLMIYAIPLLFLISGIILSAIFHFHDESWHFFSITLLPSMVIVSVIHLGTLITLRHKQLFYICLITLWGFSISGFYITFKKDLNTGLYYSNEELKTVRNILIANNTLKGGFIVKNNNFESHFNNPYFFKLGNPVDYSFRENYITGITVPLSINEFYQSNPSYKKSPIGEYISSMLMAAGDDTIKIDDLQKQFVSQKKLNYIISEPFALLPKTLIPLVSDSIHFNNGVKIYFLH